MKRISSRLRLGALALAMLALFACQKDVPRSERFTKSDGVILDPEAGATLLVEKFTGQRCVNCPSGAKQLHKLGEQYPNRMITVAHHAESSRLTLPELESEASELYAKTFVTGSFNLPGVILARRKVFDGRLYSYVRGTWTGQIEQALRIPKSYRIGLTPRAVGPREIRVQTSVMPVGQAAPRSLMLQLWVVEDFWGHQTGSGGSDHYHHEHVMRGYLNGAWGEAIALPYAGEATYTLPEAVRELRHTRVVAFVYDAESREVLEAAIAPIAEAGR